MCSWTFYSTISIIDFFLGQRQNYTFVEDGNSRIQKFFSSTEDSIVEPGLELFEVVLSSDDQLVQISRDFHVQTLFISNDDGELEKLPWCINK